MIHPALSCYTSVMVVDDNHANREVARHILDMRGWAVRCASSGLDALRQLSERASDVVLMDLHMPGMDGYETTLRLRALAETAARSPIFALTAYADAVARERCARTGLDGVLGKPFDLDAFQRLLENHVPPRTLDRERLREAILRTGIEEACLSRDTFLGGLLEGLSMPKPFSALATAAPTARDLGFPALARRCEEALAVDPLNQGAALTAVDAEARRAARVLSSVRAAVPHPGGYARSA